MGLLGTSAQAFTDDFLKTYMALGEDERATQAHKIAKQMEDAKLKEIAQEQQMREQIAQYNQGLMNHVSGAQVAPVQQNLTGYNMMGGQGLQVDQGLLSQPTQQNFPNQFEAWKAQGKDPQMESMLGQARLIAQLDPKAGINAQAALYNAAATRDTNKSNLEMRLAMQEELAKMRDATARRGQDIKITVGKDGDGYSKEDRDIVKPLFNKMPDLQKSAREAIPKIEQYRKLIGMIENGAGGIEGGLKAVLAPVAEYMGIDSRGMSEAQAYQLIARAGAGAMRLNLIGPGQVSNYEQQLIQKLSGGDIRVSREAAKQLFQYYADQSKQNIKNYNDSIDNLVGAGYKQVGSVYKKIDYTPTQEQQKSVVERRKTKDGRTLVKYSDGSIGEE